MTWRKIICLRKSEVSGRRISVCNVIENIEEHGIYCLPCSYTNYIINLLLQHLWCHTDLTWNHPDVISAKVLSTTVVYSPVAIVTDLWHIGIRAWQRVSAMLHQFLMTLWRESLSTETSNFLKQINFLVSFNSMFKRFETSRSNT